MPIRTMLVMHLKKKKTISKQNIFEPRVPTMWLNVREKISGIRIYKSKNRYFYLKLLVLNNYFYFLSTFLKNQTKRFLRIYSHYGLKITMELVSKWSQFIILYPVRGNPNKTLYNIFHLDTSLVHKYKSNIWTCWSNSSAVKLFFFAHPHQKLCKYACCK